VAAPVAVFVAADAAAAGTDDGLSFEATLDGQRIDLSTSSDPIVVEPGRESTLTLDLFNDTDAPIIVRQVQIRGGAFGVTIVTYDVIIQATVPPAEELIVDVPMDFGDLDDQATGLLPASMRLLDEERDELASQDFTMDVRGRAFSLMGVFTLVVAVATILSIVTIWIAVLRRKLPPSRWRRAIRFGVTAIGAGVTLTLLLSELRLVAPNGSVWIPIVLVPTVAALIVGYLSPGPLTIEDDAEVEDWMRRQTVISPST
jgi:hypothetical protein